MSTLKKLLAQKTEEKKEYSKKEVATSKGDKNFFSIPTLKENTPKIIQLVLIPASKTYDPEADVPFLTSVTQALINRADGKIVKQVNTDLFSNTKDRNGYSIYPNSNPLINYKRNVVNTLGYRPNKNKDFTPNRELFDDVVLNHKIMNETLIFNVYVLKNEVSPEIVNEIKIYKCSASSIRELVSKTFFDSFSSEETEVLDDVLGDEKHNPFDTKKAKVLEIEVSLKNYGTALNNTYKVKFKDKTFNFEEYYQKKNGKDYSEEVLDILQYFQENEYEYELPKSDDECKSILDEVLGFDSTLDNVKRDYKYPGHPVNITLWEKAMLERHEFNTKGNEVETSDIVMGEDDPIEEKSNTDFDLDLDDEVPLTTSKPKKKENIEEDIDFDFDDLDLDDQ